LVLARWWLVGLLLSPGFQNLIKDAINGFDHPEDQYALGDVIAVGDVAGFGKPVRITSCAMLKGA